MSAQDLERQVKAINSVKTLNICIPMELFSLIRESGHLSDIDLWASLLFIDKLRSEGWIKEVK